MLLVVVFLATAIAGLAALTSSRVVAETKQQTALEQETRAFQSAYAQLHVALNIVNTSAYNEQNHNIELRDAIAGVNGGTIAQGVAETVSRSVSIEGKGEGKTVSIGEKSGYESKSGAAGGADRNGDGIADWLDDKLDPVYGFLKGTDVRVYRGRDYIKRLQRLKGEQITDVDPFGDSDAYFVVEAAGRSGNTVRLVSALVRESEPFSSFVFFQNRATLGVSGAPRGLIHSNEKIDFYFENGNYVDSVSAVDGFGFVAGATQANTNVRDGNPEASPISLEKADFEDLKTKADLYVGEDGLDAEVRFYKNGKVRIKPHTAPRYEKTVKSYTYQKYLGKELKTVTEKQMVKVGTKEETYMKKVKVGTETENYTKWVKTQVGETTETRTREIQVKVGTQEVTKTKQEPILELQTVTKTRQVKVWQEYNDGSAGGGTSVGGGGSGAAGEWVWIDEEYQVEEWVQTGTKTVEYTVTEDVYETQTEEYTVTTPIYEWIEEPRTRTVNVYEWQERTRTVDVYEEQDVEVERWVSIYEDVTVEYETWEYFAPTYMSRKDVWLGEGKSGTMYIDGRITKLRGDLQGRLTIVGNEKVRVSGTIRYIDKNGETAMKNGNDYTQPYERNEKYTGKSVLGVIARKDIVFTSQMPKQAELNGTLMSVNGRVGIDGFWADEDGELHEDSWSARTKYMTEEEYVQEYAYDSIRSYRTRKFKKDSFRRIGGIVSNNRVMETYIKDVKGYATVAAGFKRGNMRFDINLLFNPPPNFVEVPRPVVTAFVPIVLVRNND